MTEEDNNVDGYTFDIETYDPDAPIARGMVSFTSSRDQSDFVPTGYHNREIAKGEYGELSKIVEELEELQDANEQGCKIMELVELSDLYGAIEKYLENYHLGYDMGQLKKMSDLTKRAFTNGER